MKLKFIGCLFMATPFLLSCKNETTKGDLAEAEVVVDQQTGFFI